MKFFKIEGTIFKEDTSAMTEAESEDIFNEFIKFLEERDYTFFGETQLKDTV